MCFAIFCDFEKVFGLTLQADHSRGHGVQRMIVWLSCLLCWFTQEWLNFQWDGLTSWLTVGPMINMTVFTDRNNSEYPGSYFSHLLGSHQVFFSCIFISLETPCQSVNLILVIKSIAIFMVPKIAPSHTEPNRKSLDYCLVSEKSFTSSSCTRTREFLCGQKIEL